RLERALIADGALRRELDLEPREEELALADPGFRAASPSSRLDGFIGEDGVIRFVEYNAESPAGMAYNDELSTVFAALPVMRRFRERFKVRVVPVRGRQLSAMLRAHLDGAVTVVNSFRAKLLHKKMSLALLSDDRYARLYTAPQRATIAKHVPWTRKVREGHTTYGGKVVDLADFVIANRDRLVLK